MRISIQPNPTFTKAVPVPVVGGDPVEVEFTFKYLPRDELARLQDEALAFDKRAQEELAQSSTIQDLSTRVIDFECSRLKEIVQGWGFEEELNDDNLRLFVESHRARPAAVTRAYFEAYEDARRGN